jgi:hypothetical protein
MEELILTYITHISKKSGGNCGTSLQMLVAHLEMSSLDIQPIVAKLLSENKIIQRKALNTDIYFPFIQKTKRK